MNTTLTTCFNSSEPSSGQF